MSTSGNPTLPKASPEVMGMMTPRPNPFEDEAGYLARSMAFAKRIEGIGNPFDENTIVKWCWKK